MTRSHFIEILMILTKYLFDLGVRLTEFSVAVESVTLRLYCKHFLPTVLCKNVQNSYFHVQHFIIYSLHWWWVY